jgi:putative lipoprotein
VVDGSGRLWGLHAELAPGLEPYEEVFAVVRGANGPPPAEGFGSDYPGQIRIDELLYVAGEGLGCDFDWPRFAYRAQGNEPFWWAEVAPAGLRVGLLGEKERSWPTVRESGAAAKTLFLAEGGPGEAATLSLLREPCRDSMSGAYYALSAVLALGERELRGCALPGDATRAAPP